MYRMGPAHRTEAIAHFIGYVNKTMETNSPSKMGIISLICKWFAMKNAKFGTS